MLNPLNSDAILLRQPANLLQSSIDTVPAANAARIARPCHPSDTAPPALAHAALRQAGTHALAMGLILWLIVSVASLLAVRATL